VAGLLDAAVRRAAGFCGASTVTGGSEDCARTTLALKSAAMKASVLDAASHAICFFDLGTGIPQKVTSMRAMSQRGDFLARAVPEYSWAAARIGREPGTRNLL
jgi:hypothetical protein